MATGFSHSADTCCTSLIESLSSEGLEWEQLSLTTSSPADIIFVKTSGLRDAGPRVPIIFVLAKLRSRFIVRQV